MEESPIDLRSQSNRPSAAQPGVARLEGDGAGIALLEAIEARRPEIERLIRERGAVLLRGFDVESTEDFERCAEKLTGALVDYRDRATSRSRIRGRVYSATDTSPRFEIGFHNEGSFAATWPRRLVFYCSKPAESGGRTPLSDVRRVYREIDPAVRDRFERHGVLYVRNFRSGPGMGWREVFQVDDRAELERVCAAAAVETDWLGADHLRTRQWRPAVVVHPESGERVWFNHASVLHVTGVAEELRSVLRRQHAENDLPHNVFYGDGSPIDDDVLDEIRAAYRVAEMRFEWQPGDALVIDNLRVAHGREPYRGEREVWVAMGDPTQWNEVESLPAAGRVRAIEDVEGSLRTVPTAPAPRDLADVERWLAECWAEALEVDAVGRDDDFFDLGGDSLVAAIVINRVLDVFGVELEIDDLFETPTVHAMAISLQAAFADSPGTPHPIAAHGPAALSPLQRAIWTHEKLSRGTPVYNTRWALTLRGALNRESLVRSLTEIVRRHEILRARFPNVAGRPMVEIAEVREVDLPVDDLRAAATSSRQPDVLERIATEHMQRPFDLERDDLFRARLVMIGERESVLLLCIHHIVFDGWSMGVFVRELTALYAAAETGTGDALPALPLQFVDVARERQRAIEAGELASQIETWIHRLDGPPCRVELPLDRPRGTGSGWRGASESIEVEAPLVERLRALCRAHDATLFAGLLAAFDALLGELTGTEDVVVGSFVSGRNRTEFEALIGPFLNTVALRSDLSGRPSFRTLLARSRDVVAEANANAAVPLDAIAKGSGTPTHLGRNPFFDVVFQLRNFLEARAHADGLEIEERFVDTGIARFDLFGEAREEPGGGLTLRFEYNIALLDRSTVRGWADRYRALIERAVDEPDSPFVR